MTVTPSDDVGEAVFLAATMDPPRLRVPLTEEEAARASREEVGAEDDDDLALWGF